MSDRRNIVRLSGKDLFVYYHKKIEGVQIGGCTNKRVLSKRTGVDYNTLMSNFTRRNRHFYENDDIIILKLHPGDIEKGNQSMVRRGKGGMENFLRYVRGNSY